MQQQMPTYWSAWKAFIEGRMAESPLPVALLHSWQRCAARGLDPYGQIVVEADAHPLSSASQRLLSLVRPIMEDLHQFIEESGCVVVFADAAVRLVDKFGDHTIQEDLRPPGLQIDTSWSEEHMGANALALALQESFPMQLEGAMHYCAVLHPFYSSAAPIHDLLGDAIGVLGVLGRYEQSHPHTLGMITAAAQAISNQLQMQVWLHQANDLLAELKTILQSLPEGILLLRRDGVISQINAPAGTMLGLVHTKVMGRRLSDVLPLPAALVRAIAQQQQLSDEEIVFDTVHGRVTCLCSLKSLSSVQRETGLEAILRSPRLELSEPVAADGFIMILRSIERVQKLVNRMTGARARLTFSNVVGESMTVKEAIRLARLAAQSNSTVLLRGETGTGKEIFAQSIHNSSARADGPFVAINCAAIPRELINTELFGYEGGSFTGADRQGRSGKFEQAHGGTLFLDEIGDMPLDLQTALLRAIETRSIVRVGGQRVISADVRIIAATHKDLREEAQRGTFRADLFYRLNVLTIHLPPLRERIDDIPLLVHHFLQRQSRILGRSLTIMPEAMLAIQAYSWPGNIRELENTLERVTYLMPQSTIVAADLPPELQHIALTPPAQPLPRQSKEPEEGLAKVLKEQNSQAERQAIITALHANEGQIAQAATQLGISRTTLWRKMTKYHLLPSSTKKSHS